MLVTFGMKVLGLTGLLPDDSDCIPEDNCLSAGKNIQDIGLQCCCHLSPPVWTNQLLVCATKLKILSYPHPAYF